MSKKSESKPSFPGKSNAMGYEPGLTKLEYMALHLLAASILPEFRHGMPYQDAVDLAKDLLQTCEAEQSKES